jgi:hypothetical protein
VLHHFPQRRDGSERLAMLVPSAVGALQRTATASLDASGMRQEKPGFLVLERVGERGQKVWHAHGESNPAYQDENLVS